MINMKIIDRLTEAQISQLHALYGGEWWCESRTLEQTKRCVEGSQIIIGVINKYLNFI